MQGSLLDINPHKIRELNQDEFKQLIVEVNKYQQADLQENALYYYKPVSSKVGEFHASNAGTVGIFGGNGSSKTESAIVEMLILATGIVPASLKDVYSIDKFRGPVSCRLICESLTTVLETVILPKLQYWRWTGVDRPGGQRGHWGWIPKDSLIGGKWDQSWQAKTRTLTVYHRNPEKYDEILGQSSIQFMSHDQEAPDFASGDFHYILIDEPTRYAIWRENQARRMRVRGRIVLAMTWPDEPTMPVDWIFDEVYDPAMNKKPSIEVYNLYTTENQNLDQEAVRAQMDQWSDAVKKVRIFGGSMRFSNRIHPLFSDGDIQWCFRCKAETIIEERVCVTCQSAEVITFSHVQDREISHNWPVVFALDPHPRKPHMMAWYVITPHDDVYQVAELDADDGTPEVSRKVLELEAELGLYVTVRLIDPHMGQQTANAKTRGVTWREEFENVNLRCELASSSDVGRSRINEYLEPDEHTYEPRFVIHPRCAKTIFQFKRYVWDEYKLTVDKDVKQKPKDKNDDYPTLAKYVMNTDPSFRVLASEPIVIRKRGRKGGY